jgi:hypothetical protein
MVSKISSFMTPLQRARLDGRPTSIYPDSSPRSAGPGEQIQEIFGAAELVMKELDNEYKYSMLLGQAPQPTPIGPWGIKVVDTVLLEECMPQLLDDTFAEILFPLLHRKRKPPLAKVVVSDLLERPTKKMRNWSPPAAKSWEEEEDDSQELRIRSYQADLWELKLEELITYRKKTGHCLVPHNWGENTPLAQWVNRQRYQYKLKMRGEHSTMTTKRENILEEMGFVWSSHAAVREERLNEIRDFSKTFGHCNVPSAWKENRKLSVWVKSQRRQYKLFRRGENRSTMTQDRIDKLTDLGFVWNPRSMELGPQCEAGGGGVERFQ